MKVCYLLFSKQTALSLSLAVHPAVKPRKFISSSSINLYRV